MNRETLFVRLKDKRGTVTIVVVLAMLFLLGFAAFAIDVSYMMVSRNQLQNIADTAALAAAGDLGASYAGKTLSQQLAYVPDAGVLLTVAQSVASKTGISGVTILSSDLRLGNWDFTTHNFTPASTGPTAVNVTARKDNVANGPVTTLLAQVLGMSSFNVSASATASLAPPNNVPSGGLPLPVGISLYWFSTPGYCTNPITLYPTGDSCAGWNVYEEWPASANKLNTILTELNNGTYSSPDTIAGQTSFNFTGGTLTSVFDEMQTLFNTMKVKNDGVLDKDNDPNTWTTAVPVYDWPDCSNPNARGGGIKIVGFSTIVIKSIVSVPTKVINAQVVCNSIISGSGGGLTLTQTYGTLPNLVQ